MRTWTPGGLANQTEVRSQSKTRVRCVSQPGSLPHSGFECGFSPVKLLPAFALALAGYGEGRIHGAGQHSV